MHSKALVEFFHRDTKFRDVIRIVSLYRRTKRFNARLRS